MNTNDFLNLVFFQNGEITISQYIQMYDCSPTLQCVFYDKNAEYKFECWFTDKSEPIFFNVKND